MKLKTSIFHNDPASQYALDVVEGRVIAGPYVRQACQRHLDDLRDGPSRGLKWDVAKYQHVVGFFRDALVLNGGEHEGEPFILQPFQVFMVGNIFGWLGSDGYRRFRTAYIEQGKGNGKSPLAGGIGLYMLACDGEGSAECYAAATTRDQAKILFKDAVHMVETSPALKKRFELSGKRDVFNIAYLKTNSFFRPISSEGKSLDGKRVHYAAIDEIHEHTSDVVVNKIRFGTKGRRQALILEITNSGSNRNSICYHHHDYSRKILSGELKNDAWFAYVCALDEGDDPFTDKSCWIKANPNLGVSISEKYIEEQVLETRGIPSNQSKVRRWNFCQWVDADNPWIDSSSWLACENMDFDEEELTGCDVYGGLDLSGTNDLTACALAFKLMDGRIALKTFFWMPRDGIAEKVLKDKVPYDLWEKDGYIETTPGRSVDYRFVATKLGELQARYNISSIAFDTYRIKYLERELDEQNVEINLVPHGQGYYKAQQSALWMPRSLECLEQRVLAQSIVIVKNPVLTWNSSSAQVEADPKGNRIFTKRKSTGRIDGIVASAMAIGMADNEGAATKSFWETIDISELNGQMV